MMRLECRLCDCSAVFATGLSSSRLDCRLPWMFHTGAQATGRALQPIDGELAVMAPADATAESTLIMNRFHGG